MPRKAFLIRIDDKILEGLERWADDELRSLNGQIEYLLREALVKRRANIPAEPSDPDEDHSNQPHKS